MQKFPGQGLNLHHSNEPSHNSDNARSLIHWAIRELLKLPFFFFWSFFWGRTHGIWRFPGSGSNWTRSRRPTPKPLPCEMRAASATYTTARGNTGSLTHWARPGSKPGSSWVLLRFISSEPPGNSWSCPFYYTYVVGGVCPITHRIFF